MPRYVIHIGPHKTGTTYLQHAFTRLRPALQTRGILYPDAWGGQHGHHGLATALSQDDAGTGAAFDRLNHSDADTILLSSENFAYAADADVRRLKALLSGRPATVVFACRRWSELIPSSWHESVKHGALMTMPEFVLACMSNPATSAVINFGHVLDRYAAVFGPGSLRLISYNSVMEAGDDLLAHFCRHVLDWPDPPPLALGRVNESLDMVDSEIIRALNALEWTRARGQGERLYKAYIAHKATLPVRHLVETAMQFVVNRVRIDDASPALSPIQAALAERYGPALLKPAPACGLFEPRAADIDYIQTDYLLAPGALDTLRAIQASLLRSLGDPLALAASGALGHGQ